MFLDELKNELDGLLELFDEDEESGEYTFLNSAGYGEIRLNYSSGSKLTKCVSFVNKIMDSIAY